MQKHLPKGLDKKIIHLIQELRISIYSHYPSHSSKTMIEKRANKRVNTNFKATLLHNHHSSLVQVTDCSENGACLMSISGIFPCTMLDINLLIPVAKKPIKLFGKIVRVTEINNRHTIGVQFVKPTKRYLEFLSEL